MKINNSFTFIKGYIDKCVEEIVIRWVMVSTGLVVEPSMIVLMMDLSES